FGFYDFGFRDSRFVKTNFPYTTVLITEEELSMDNRSSSATHTAKMQSVKDDDSVPGLVRQVVDDASAIVTKEVALVKAEIAQAAEKAKKGISSVATGGAVAYAGLLFLLLSATLGLSLVVDMWLAALIVGGVVLIIGLLMLQAGKKKLDAQAFKPEHTANTFRKHG